MKSVNGEPTEICWFCDGVCGGDSNECGLVRLKRYQAVLESIAEDAEQIVLRDGHALPADVYTLTRRIFMNVNEALKHGRK